MAAIATFALKPGVWFRRVRLVIVSPDSQRTACLLSGRNSTYRPVQISGTSSDHACLRLFAQHGLQHADVFLGPWSQLHRLLRHCSFLLVSQNAAPQWRGASGSRWQKTCVISSKDAPATHDGW